MWGGKELRVVSTIHFRTPTSKSSGVKLTSEAWGLERNPPTRDTEGSQSGPGSDVSGSQHRASCYLLPWPSCLPCRVPRVIPQGHRAIQRRAGCKGGQVAPSTSAPVEALPSSSRQQGWRTYSFPNQWQMAALAFPLALPVPNKSEWPDLEEAVREVQVAQSCPTLCDPIDSTVHGILQARILEWVAFPFSRGSSQPRDRTQVSRIAGGFFTI